MDARHLIQIQYPEIQFEEVEITNLGTFTFIVGNELIVRVGPFGDIHEEQRYE